MVLGRGYGVVLRWFGVVGMVRPRDGFGSWVWCGLEMVSGRGYGVVLRWFRVVGMVRPRDGFRSWALRGHEMVWVMGMVGPWEDHRYSEVLKGLGRGYESISVGVERGLRMDRTDEEFKELSQRVDGFILDAQKKFDGAVAAFSASTFPFLDKVSQNSKSSLQDIARLERDKVDSCLLKACAIEHSKDEDVAVEVVLDEIIPNLPAETRKVSSPKNGKSTLKIYEG
ncbi:hypothetical protein Tco_1415847, partial [Tanacetum coccineum]